MGQTKQPCPRSQVDDEIDVAIGAIFSTGDAAEHSDVVRAVASRTGDDRLSVMAKASTEGRIRKTGRGVLIPLQSEREMMASRLDEPGEGGQGRGAAAAFVGADHTLGNPGALGDISLGKACSLASLS